MNKSTVDWYAVEVDCCAGMSLRAMARKHGVSHVAIKKEKDKKGWVKGGKPKKKGEVKEGKPKRKGWVKGEPPRVSWRLFGLSQTSTMAFWASC